jgi:hypothetical protein
MKRNMARAKKRKASDTDESSYKPSPPQGLLDRAHPNEIADSSEDYMVQLLQAVPLNKLTPTVLVPDSQEDIAPSTSKAIESKTSQTLHRRKLMSLRHEQGYLALIDQVYEDERNGGHSLMSNTSLETFRRVCVPIIASMHDEVLAGLVHGDLGKRHADGDKVLEELFGKSASRDNTAWMKNAEGATPTLYGRTLIDERGNPPTREAKLKIAYVLRRYVSRELEDISIAMQIDKKPPEHRRRDKITRDDVVHGNHAYLSNKSGRIDARVARIETFCSAVEQNCQIPLPDGLSNDAWFYIGWSMVPMDRLRAHDDGKTNFLIALVARIANILYPDTFHIESFILAYLATEEEIAYGGILLTGIASAYHQYGTGFCVHPAGMNNQSARLETSNVKDAKQIWDACQSWRKLHTPFIDNMNRLDAFLDKETKARAERVAKTKQTLLDLRREKDRLRPDFEATIKFIEDSMPVQPGERAALGDELADLFQREADEALSKIRARAAAWDAV